MNFKKKGGLVSVRSTSFENLMFRTIRLMGSCGMDPYFIVIITIIIIIIIIKSLLTKPPNL
jgi:hypothetical protein